jgi:hypothetical protein
LEADHAIDLGVAQFLRGGRALLRVGGVVFGLNFQAYLLAADGDALGVQVLDGHPHAVVVVLAVGRLRAGHRRHMADLDDLHLLRGCQSGNHGDGRGDRHFEFDLHRRTSKIGIKVENLVGLNGRDHIAKSPRRPEGKV